MAGGKVKRKGTAYTVHDTAMRAKRKCRSAPEAPANVAMDFSRRRSRGHHIWRGKVSWDAVDLDVSGRPVGVELYQVQMRAVDASGDPVETQLQAKAATANGSDSSVVSGTAPVNKRARELDTAGDVISFPLTGLTVGIEAQVNFYARKDAGGSSPVVKCVIWNYTDTSIVTSKNGSPEKLVKPDVIATQSFTPQAGKTYKAYIERLGGTGVALFDHIQWHDKGNAAIWTHVTHDPDTTESFAPLERPASWYYTARVRTLNRVHGRKCWSAWSDWTAAQQPVGDELVGPPAVDGIALSMDKVEGSAKHPWRARVRWNETGMWVPADDDPLDGSARYIVQLAASNDGGSTTANTRRRTSPSGDDTTQQLDFFNIRGKRHYRARVQPVDVFGRKGAWSSWTTWISPGGAPEPVENLTWSNPTPGTLVARWDRPTDPTDVDRYRVVVIRQPGSVTVDEGFTSGNRWTYHIPVADRDNTHRVRVVAVEDDTFLDIDDSALGLDTVEESTSEETADVANAALWTADDIDTTTLPPPASDGDAPAAGVTGLAAFGGVGFISLRWVGVANADQVTYDVHISLTSGFTPSGTTVGTGTCVGNIEGTIAFVRKMANGDPLVYRDTNDLEEIYYLKVVPRDVDGSGPTGSEVAVSMTEINQADIAVGVIAAEHIQAGTLSTQELGAATAVINSLIAGDQSTQHLELDGQGLRFYDSSGKMLINLPTDPTKKPTFEGDLVTQNLTVNGATIIGATSVTPGSTMTLQSSVQAPGNAPAVDITYPPGIVVEDSVGATMVEEWYALAYTASGGAGGATPSFYSARPGGGGGYWRVISEIRASDGVVTRNLELPNGGDDDCWGLVAIGTNLYVLFQRWSTGDFKLHKYQLSDLTATATASLGAVGGTHIKTEKPGLGTDGTNLFIVMGQSQASGVDLRLSRWSTSLVWQNVTTQSSITFDCRENGGNRTTEFGGFIKVGSTYYLAVYSYSGAAVLRRRIYPMSGDPTITNNMAQIADEQFPGELGAEANGIAHDGTNFWTILENRHLTKHTSWLWTVASGDKWYWAFTWHDNAGTKHETALSPRAPVTMQGPSQPDGTKVPWRRASLSLSTPAIPAGGADDPDTIRVYAKQNATDPGSAFASYFDQGGPVSGTVNRYDTYLSAAAGAQDTAFVPGTPSILDAQLGKFLTRAIAVTAHKNATDQTVANGTVAVIAWGANLWVSIPSGGLAGDLHDTATNNSRFKAPAGYEGIYQLSAHIAVDASASHARVIVTMRKNAAGSDSGGTLLHQVSEVIGHATTGGWGFDFTALCDLSTAGDYVELFFNAVDEGHILQGAASECAAHFNYLGRKGA